MFEYSDRTQQLRERLLEFMDQYIYPNEKTFEEQHAAQSDRWTAPPIMDELKAKAKSRGCGTCSCRKASMAPV